MLSVPVENHCEQMKKVCQRFKKSILRILLLLPRFVVIIMYIYMKWRHSVRPITRSHCRPEDFLKFFSFQLCVHIGFSYIVMFVSQSVSCSCHSLALSLLPVHITSRFYLPHSHNPQVNSFSQSVSHSLASTY